MNTWIVEYVDGKSEKFNTGPDGIQILNPALAVLIVHRVLGQPPIFINMTRVQKWYSEAGPSLITPSNPAGLVG